MTPPSGITPLTRHIRPAQPIKKHKPKDIKLDTVLTDYRGKLGEIIDNLDILKLNSVGWEDVRNYPSLKDAVATITPNQRTLLVSSPVHLAKPTTVPSRISLWVLQGGSFSGAKLTVNGNFEAGLYQVFKGDIEVDLGVGSAKEIYTEWWGITDVGSSMNKAFSSVSSIGGKIVLPNNKYPCSTTIDFDLVDKDTPIALVGTSAGWRDSATTNGGTIIDGSGMATEVISGARTAAKYFITLKDIIVLAGSAEGILMGDADNSYSCADSFFENIAIRGGTDGFVLDDAYDCWVNKIYCEGQSTTGFYAERCNAAKFGMITVRHCTGSWAMVINNGSGTDFGNLYLESNYKSALQVAGNIRGSVIQSIYLENNNRDGTEDYEVIIGDTDLSALDIDSLTINGCLGNNPNVALAEAQIGIGKISQLTMNGLRGKADPLLKVLGDIDQRLLFHGCSIYAVDMDFSAALDDSYITFEACELVDVAKITYPTNDVGFNIIGCNSAFEKEKMLSVSSATALRNHQTLIVVNTNSAAVTITLPKELTVGDKIYSVINIGTSGNNVTVTGAADLIMGSANSTITDLEGASYRNSGTQWMVVGRGAK